MFEGMKAKFEEADKDTKWMILTACPKSMSSSRIKSEFSIGFAKAEKAKQLQREKGNSNLIILSFAFIQVQNL